MRRLLLGFALLGMAGCSDLDEALTGEGRKPVSPPGILPVDQMGGDIEQVAAAKAPANPAPPPAPPPQEKKSIVGKTTNKVVDYQKAIAENPKLMKVKNEIDSYDPLTQAGSAYIAMSSRIGSANMKHQIDLMHATEGRWPTHQEFMDVARQHRMEFPMLPAYQMYGYDDQTGEVMILEDPEERARIYEEAGIPRQK